MPAGDAARWNARYQQAKYTTSEGPRSFLVRHADLLPQEGLAIDVAMGLGGNAGFLIQRGLKVIGVDISDTAVRRARQLHPGLMAVIADLTHFSLPAAAFDVILNFYYLQRDLWPAYHRALRPGGLLVFQTLTQEMRQSQPDVDPAYLLAPGELRRAFDDMEILFYEEGWEASRSGSPRAVASLIARQR